MSQAHCPSTRPPGTPASPSTGPTALAGGPARPERRHAAEAGQSAQNRTQAPTCREHPFPSQLAEGQPGDNS